MRKSSHAAGLFSRQQATGGHHIDNGGKRGRSGAGVSSPATGSSISERAVSQTSADSDRQDGWTVVRRKRRGRNGQGDSQRRWRGIAGPRRSPGRPHSNLRLKPSLQSPSAQPRRCHQPVLHLRGNTYPDASAGRKGAWNSKEQKPRRRSPLVR